MKHLLIVILLLCLASCAGSRKAITSTTSQQQNEYVNTARLDSLLRAIQRRDSAYVRDSIYVREKGDTVAIYKERTRYKYIALTDTVYKYKVLRDTVYKERTDSVTVEIEKPVYIEKAIPWYNQGFIWLGKAVGILALLLLLYWAIKKRT